MSLNPLTPLLRSDCATTLVYGNREPIFFNVLMNFLLRLAYEAT